MSRHVFLTGPPGIGKTTLIHKTIDVLKTSGIPVDGFYTEEVRKNGRRVGFDVVTVSGKRGTLSRISNDSGIPNSRRCEYRVGQYAVDLPSFERLVLPLLEKVNDREDMEKKVYVIDEIGKMELFSEPFIHSVHQILDGVGATILGTIPVPKGKPLRLVEEIRSRREVKIFNITKDNRNSIVQEIVTSVQDCRKLKGN
ncbi:cancer-related nucleoside-triphosphatase [Scyliorhinus canicula]|uniref:cancer-related nucleoside-triphosphatase n=1 Tax=Scyliorhinus canicula TaxID=7830 RepID=UPI0018F7B7DE|nr:cancer-related nucleoside-triphosphatase [Scyliorhinus canicula]